MIIGDGIMLGAGGESASIFVTGLSETDTVTASKDVKTVTGKWTQKPNPAWHGLPDGYTELEYIQSTGTQYIDTGYSTGNASKLQKMSFEITCAYYDIETGSTSELVNGNGNAYLGYINGKFYAAWGRNGGILTNSTIVPNNQMHTWSVDTTAREFWFDDILVESDAIFDGSANSYGLLYLFGSSPTELNSCRIAHAAIKYNDEFVRNFIPCRRNSDGTLGMYDTVNNEFYTNAGTGEFVAGAEVPQTIGGFLIDKIKSYGIWTVTATDGTHTKTQDVLVDSANVFSVEIDYKQWLYRDGDECEDVTGGWEGEAAEWSSEVKGQFSVYKRDTYLECYGNNGAGSCFFTTANPIDVTNYSQLHFVSKRSNASGGSRMRTSTTKPYYSTGNYLPTGTDVLSADFPSTEKAEAVLDISAIAGDVYIFMLVSGYTSYLYEVWLE